jgi:hypothetical protein
MPIVTSRKAFYNAELLCEEGGVIFTVCMEVKRLKIEHDIFVYTFLNLPL